MEASDPRAHDLVRWNLHDTNRSRTVRTDTVRSWASTCAIVSQVCTALRVATRAAIPVLVQWLWTTERRACWWRVWVLQSAVLTASSGAAVSQVVCRGEAVLPRTRGHDVDSDLAQRFRCPLLRQAVRSVDDNKRHRCSCKNGCGQRRTVDQSV